MVTYLPTNIRDGLGHWFESMRKQASFRARSQRSGAMTSGFITRCNIYFVNIVCHYVLSKYLRHDRDGGNGAHESATDSRCISASS